MIGREEMKSNEIETNKKKEMRDFSELLLAQRNYLSIHTHAHEISLIWAYVQCVEQQNSCTESTTHQHASTAHMSTSNITGVRMSICLYHLPKLAAFKDPPISYTRVKIVIGRDIHPLNDIANALYHHRKIYYE